MLNIEVRFRECAVGYVCRAKVGRVGHNHQNDAVDNDHPFHKLQDPFILKHKSESRIQYKTLASNHHAPSKIENDFGKPEHPKFEICQHHAEAVEHDAEIAESQRPEVETLPFFEGGGDEQEEFEGVIEADGDREGDYD